MKTKAQRKEWWNNLSTEDKAIYTRKYENKRNTIKRKKMILPELTQDEILRINDNMRLIGMEQYIVLYEVGEVLY